MLFTQNWNLERRIQWNYVMKKITTRINVTFQIQTSVNGDFAEQIKNEKETAAIR